jgi:hypothetical protein
MTNNIGRPPEAWRNYSTKTPIVALFRIKRDELKRLYQIIHAKQIEYRDKVVATLSRMPSESNDDFEGRKQKVHDAFVTSVTVTGLDDEMVHENAEEFFDSSTSTNRRAALQRFGGQN